MRILCLDFGSKTVGVAVSDALGMTAQGVEIIRRDTESHLRGTLRRIEELVREYGVGKIVLGYPLNMDDTVGDRAEKTLGFKTMLESRLSVPVFLHDERLTTVEADDIMDEAQIKKRDRAKYVDMIAAQIILEDWMREYENGKD